MTLCMDEKTVPIKKALIKKGLQLEKKKKRWRGDLFGHALYEQMGECVFIIGLDLQYLAANRQALDLLGYTEDEILTLSVSDVMSLGDALDQKDQTNIYERTFKRKDGTLIPVELSTAIVADEDGSPAYIQSIVRDISERKRSEKALKRSARILSVISEASARLFRSPDIELGISEMLELLGIALDTFACVIFELDNFQGTRGLNVRYSWVDGDAAGFDIPSAIQPHFQSLLSAQGNVVVEIKASANEVVPEFSFLAVPVQGTGGLGGFLGLFDRENKLSWLASDFDAVQTSANVISAALQRIHYEETIRLNQARNRAIVDALPDLVIRINAETIILDYSCNPDHPLYIHRDLIAGKKFNETWPEEIVASIVGAENGETYKVSNWVEGFNLPFSSSLYEARLNPINDHEALIIIRDIGDKMRLNDMKTDFINRASHELRTPLTSAILMADLIDQGGTAEELDEYWQTLRKELDRQKNLIDRLLMAGRLESGMMKLEKASLELFSVLEESVQAARPLANKKRVSLVLDTSLKPVQVLADRGALEQVFINLISNAVKFSPENSSVEIVANDVGEHAEVRIQDHGMGISKDAIPHLFQKFYRAKNVTIAEIPGSGIGLYIVKTIVEELGGTIRVESELNKGTVFIVSLQKSE